MARKWNNPDLRKATRMASDEDGAFGIVCYEGKAEGGMWNGAHRGVAASAEDAERWLRGSDVKLVRIYPEADDE